MGLVALSMKLGRKTKTGRASHISLKGSVTAVWQVTW